MNTEEDLSGDDQTQQIHDTVDHEVSNVTSSVEQTSNDHEVSNMDLTVEQALNDHGEEEPTTMRGWRKLARQRLRHIQDLETTFTEFQESSAELEKELEKQLSDTNEILTSTGDELNETKKMLQSKTDEVKQANLEKDALHEEISKLTKRIRVIQNQADEHEENVRRAQVESERVQRQYEETQEQLVMWQSECSELQEKIQIISDERDKLSEEIAELKAMNVYTPNNQNQNQSPMYDVHQLHDLSTSSGVASLDVKSKADEKLDVSLELVREIEQLIPMWSTTVSKHKQSDGPSGFKAIQKSIVDKVVTNGLETYNVFPSVNKEETLPKYSIKPSNLAIISTNCHEFVVDRPKLETESDNVERFALTQAESGYTSTYETMIPGKELNDPLDALVQENAALLAKLLRCRNRILVLCRMRPFTDSEAQNFTKHNTFSSLPGHDILPGSHSPASQNITGVHKIMDAQSASSSEGSGILHILSDNELALYDEARLAWRPFVFDRVLGPEAGQHHVLQELGHLPEAVLEGLNVCIFAYGITGSGKTHTMIGPPKDPGLMLRSIDKVLLLSKFASKQLNQKLQTKQSSLFTITMSVLEIYNDEMRDLVQPFVSDSMFQCTMPGADVDESGAQSDVSDHSRHVFSSNVQQVSLHGHDVLAVPLTSLSDARLVLQSGLRARATAATNVHEHSSRSHLIVMIDVHGPNLGAGLRNAFRPDIMSVTTSDGSQEISGFDALGQINGRLYLVDLAGSERVRKSAVTGMRLREAQHINRSLAALGDVFEALDKKSQHIPYRNSKLTYLLQDGLGGNAKTAMLCNVCPSTFTSEETLFSLQFAARTRRIEMKQARRAIEYRNLNTELRQIRRQLHLSETAKNTAEAEVKSLQESQTKIDQTSHAALLEARKTYETHRQAMLVEIQELKKTNSTLRRKLRDLQAAPQDAPDRALLDKLRRETHTITVLRQEKESLLTRMGQLQREVLGLKEQVSSARADLEYQRRKNQVLSPRTLSHPFSAPDKGPTNAMKKHLSPHELPKSSVSSIAKSTHNSRPETIKQTKKLLHNHQDEAKHTSPNVVRRLKMDESMDQMTPIQHNISQSHSSKNSLMKHTPTELIIDDRDHSPASQHAFSLGQKTEKLDSNISTTTSHLNSISTKTNKGSISRSSTSNHINETSPTHPTTPVSSAKRVADKIAAARARREAERAKKVAAIQRRNRRHAQVRASIGRTNESPTSPPGRLGQFVPKPQVKSSKSISDRK